MRLARVVADACHNNLRLISAALCAIGEGRVTAQQLVQASGTIPPIRVTQTDGAQSWLLSMYCSLASVCGLVFGPLHRHTLAILTDTVEMQRARGSEMQDLMLRKTEEALWAHVRAHGAEHPRSVRVAMVRAQMLAQMSGGSSRALRALDAVWLLCTRVLGDAHPYTCATVRCLGRLLGPAKEEALYRRALDAGDVRRHAPAAGIALQLAACLTRRGDHAAAELELRAAERMARDGGAVPSDIRLRISCSLATCLLLQPEKRTEALNA